METDMYLICQIIRNGIPSLPLSLSVTVCCVVYREDATGQEIPFSTYIQKTICRRRYVHLYCSVLTNFQGKYLYFENNILQPNSQTS